MARAARRDAEVRAFSHHTGPGTAAGHLRHAARTLLPLPHPASPIRRSSTASVRRCSRSCYLLRDGSRKRSLAIFSAVASTFASTSAETSAPVSLDSFIRLPRDRPDGCPPLLRQERSAPVASVPHGVVFAVRGEEGAQPASLLRLHILPVLGPKSLKDITPSDIMVPLASKREVLSPASLLQRQIQIGAVFKYAIEMTEMFRGTNPVKKTPKVKDLRSTFGTLSFIHAPARA